MNEEDKHAEVEDTRKDVDRGFFWMKEKKIYLKMMKAKIK